LLQLLLKAPVSTASALSRAIQGISHIGLNIDDGRFGAFAICAHAAASGRVFTVPAVSRERRSCRLGRRVHRPGRIERDLELIQLELGTWTPEATLEARDERRCAADLFSSDRRSRGESATVRAVARDRSNHIGVFGCEHVAVNLHGADSGPDG
jgi:hypothetical protein